jgi:DNA-directed RNA polymerase specialized sigma24 family protein
MNIREATSIDSTEAERTALASMVRSAKTEQRPVERARIVLLAGVGRSTRSIAAEVGCSIGTASKWRVRFAVGRIAGLRDHKQFFRSRLPGGRRVGALASAHTPA